MPRWIVLGLVIALGSGCATPAPKSLARQVAEAGGLKLHDAPQDRLAQATPGDPSAVPATALAVGTGTGVFTPPTGLSVGTATGLLATGALVTALSVDEAVYSRLIAWMPRTAADNADAANREMASLVHQALAQALPDYEVTRSAKRYSTRGLDLAITGPGCATPCLFSIALLDSAQEARAPDFLGGYPAYAWTSDRWTRRAFWRPGPSLRPEVNPFPWGQTWLSPAEKLEVYRRLSAHLPSWAYLYIAPSRFIVDYPIIVNQSQVHLFLAPEALTPADG